MKLSVLFAGFVTLTFQSPTFASELFSPYALKCADQARTAVTKSVSESNFASMDLEAVHLSVTQSDDKEVTNFNFSYRGKDDDKIIDLKGKATYKVDDEEKCVLVRDVSVALD